MNSVRKNFNRHEEKYIVSLENLAKIFEYLRERLSLDPYSKMRSDGFYAVTNLYFDSDDFRCYYERMDNSGSGVKIRLRSYDNAIGPDSIIYPEIKERIGEFVTKDRFPIPSSSFESFISSPKEFLHSHSGKDQDAMKRFIDFMNVMGLKPKAVMRYDRAAFIDGESGKLRITVDKNFFTGRSEIFTDKNSLQEIFTGQVIVEIKFSNGSSNFLKSLLNEYKLEKTTASKHCLAIEHSYALGERKL